VGKAARGLSKDGSQNVCSDCPLVTLAMVLNGSGFVRRTQVFAGNASEPATLQEMLTGLGAAPGATVVMDAGIATEPNLKWLRAQGLHYVVKSRLEVASARAPVRPCAGHRSANGGPDDRPASARH
jgi:transposase